MDGRTWLALIADLRSSREIPARERPRVDRALRQAIVRVMRLHGSHFRMTPEVLRGDELQAVLRPDAPALMVLTYLRAQLVLGAGRGVALRAGLGRGTIQRLSPRGPFSSDGEAFHRARAALESTKRSGGARLTGWITGDPSVDRFASVTLALIDSFASRWTGPQWEAIAGRLEGKGLDAIARERQVSFQSVSKRLRAASWSEVQQASELLEAAARGPVRGAGASERATAPSAVAVVAEAGARARAGAARQASVSRARPLRGEQTHSPSRG